MKLIRALFLFAMAAGGFLALHGTTSTSAGDQKPYLTFGIAIASIEEGARIFTPIRLLPFDHPESYGHEFPNALQLHQSEVDTLVFLGEKLGYGLRTTLIRYPMDPATEWKYPAFQYPQLQKAKSASVKTLKLAESPIPGLKLVLFVDRFPLCFIVDTRSLTLQQRGMKRATAMGLDMTRKHFLEGLAKTGKSVPERGNWIVIYKG